MTDRQSHNYMNSNRILYVNPNGEGNFKTLSEASSYLFNSTVPTTLYVSCGHYKESVVFQCSNLEIIGENAASTIVEDAHFAKEMHPDGFLRGTFWTAVVRLDGNNLTLRNLSIINSAGPGKKAGQAIALYCDGLGILVDNCILKANQDTLFTAPFPLLNKHGLNEGFGPKQNCERTPSVIRFSNSYIEGDVDFIFGGATALFENCRIFSHDPDKSNPLDPVKGYIAAPSTVNNLKYGYLFLNCELDSDCPSGTVFLARPWRPFGKAVFIGCRAGAHHICTDLFNDWDDIHNRETCFFAVDGFTLDSVIPNAAAYKGFGIILSDSDAREYTDGFLAYISIFFGEF